MLVIIIIIILQAPENSAGGACNGAAINSSSWIWLLGDMLIQFRMDSNRFASGENLAASIIMVG